MDYMEVDGGGEDSNDGSVEKSFSVLGFLRKVFREELRDDNSGDHKLIVSAIHAVLLESGFVLFDAKSNGQINGFQFFYTLPEIIHHAGGGDPIDCVVLNFQSLDKYVNVYGSLANGAGAAGRSVTHWMRLNEDQLLPFLTSVRANCGLIDGRFLGEKEVITLWRDVKDNLALPLLIDLCEEVPGFQLPPCFMRLPSELKLKILELLPAVDVAKVSCACSELWFLASSDDLWMLKYAEEIGADGVDEHGGWKKAFVRTCIKNRELGASQRSKRMRVHSPNARPRIRRRGNYVPSIEPTIS